MMPIWHFSTSITWCLTWQTLEALGSFFLGSLGRKDPNYPVVCQKSMWFSEGVFSKPKVSREIYRGMLRGKTDPTLFQFHAGTSYRPDYFVGSKQGGFNIDQLSMMNIRFQLQTCANLSHMQINLSRVQTCEIGLHARNIKRTYFGISTSAEMLSASRSNVVPWSLISLVTICRSGLAEYMGSLAGHSQQLASQSFDHRLVHILSKKGRPQNFFHQQQ